MRFLLLAAVCCLALPAFAEDELTPEKTAQVEREKTKAFAEVDKKYGNRKPNELSNEERRAIARERSEAEQSVYEKHAINAKDYTRYTAKMGRDDRAAAKAAGEKLEAKEKADSEKDAKEKSEGASAGPKEIVIQRGFNDNNPVIMEEKPGAAPIVEKGLPQDYQNDQTAASGGTEPSPAAPAPAKGKKK